MTDQRPPQDPSQPKDVEGIIELTDVVSSPEAEDEEIINLTEVVDEDDQEALIELTDVIDASAGTAAKEEAPLEEPEVEPVIDLTEVVDASADTAAEEVGPLEEPEAEPLIDLTEVVTAEMADTESLEEEAVASEPAEEERVDEAESSTSGELEFAEMELDIEDRKEDGLFDSLGMNLEADLLPSAEDTTSELDFNLSTQELSDAIDLLDAKLAEEPPKPPEVEEDTLKDPSALRSEELEAALENVIRKMFSEKIDSLLNEAIEKTVSKEIERLKQQLLGDASDKP